MASQCGGCYQLPLNPVSSSSTRTSASSFAESLRSTSSDSEGIPLSESSASSTSSEDSESEHDNNYLRLQVTTQGSIRDARFCLGVEKYSDAQGQTVHMARLLHGPDGVTADNAIVKACRMD